MKLVNMKHLKCFEPKALAGSSPAPSTNIYKYRFESGPDYKK